ncbi:MAG: kanamycin nucleotidyltransferase C-terminal domain-containing protein [Salinibacter sp.]
MDGPTARTNADRRALVEQIQNRLLTAYGDDVRAIGLHGSTARGDDGPYSDIEMICAVTGSTVDHRYEWSTGEWKAEVNVRSQDVLEQKAKTVDVDWPMTHGKYLDMEPRYDPEHLFEHLRELAASQSDDAFHQAIKDSVVGEQYELMGKLRNANHRGERAHLPTLAVELAKHAACMVALAHRKTFNRATSAFPEALGLAHRPQGFDALCSLVMQGQLSNPEHVIDVCESYWSKLDEWLARISINAREELTIPI